MLMQSRGRLSRFSFPRASDTSFGRRDFGVGFFGVNPYSEEREEDDEGEENGELFVLFLRGVVGEEDDDGELRLVTGFLHLGQ